MNVKRNLLFSFACVGCKFSHQFHRETAISCAFSMTSETAVKMSSNEAVLCSLTCGHLRVSLKLSSDVILAELASFDRSFLSAAVKEQKLRKEKPSGVTAPCPPTETDEGAFHANRSRHLKGISCADLIVASCSGLSVALGSGGNEGTPDRRLRRSLKAFFRPTGQRHKNASNFQFFLLRAQFSTFETCLSR